MIRRGGCLLSGKAKAQTVEAQSSGESETYAGAGGTSVGMLHKAVLEFFEFEVGTPKLRMDSKAAKAIVTRLGVGQVRHLEVKILWIQHLTKQKRLQVWKIDGERNIADLGTKALAKERFHMLLTMANIKRIKDVEQIPETKVVGGVRLAAGSTAPARQQRELPEVVSTRALLAALVALLRPQCARSD